MTNCNNNGIEAYATVRRFLNMNGWTPEEVTGESAFISKGDNEFSPINYYFQVKVELEQFLFYIHPVITLLPEMLPVVAEFIARANFGMRIGNFELDYRTREISFRSSLNFKGVPLSDPLIDGVIRPAMRAYEEFFPGLAKVIAGLDTPAHAIQIIEYGE